MFPVTYDSLRRPRMIQMEEAYRYLGVPLTSAVAEFVIVSQLGGKQLKRS
jgi:hypothetical protein